MNTGHKTEPIAIEFTHSKAGIEADKWTHVRYAFKGNAYATLGYVAKLDAIQSHGSKRAHSFIRGNSWWVASLTTNPEELLPEHGCSEGVGKFETRKEACTRLLQEHGLI